MSALEDAFSPKVLGGPVQFPSAPSTVLHWYIQQTSIEYLPHARDWAGHLANRQPWSSRSCLAGVAGEPQVFLWPGRELQRFQLCSGPFVSPFPWLASIHHWFHQWICSVQSHLPVRHTHTFTHSTKIYQAYISCQILLWDIVENKTGKNPCPHGVYISIE